MIFKFKKLFIFGLFIFLFLPLKNILAVDLFFESSDDNIKTNQQFQLDLFIDTNNKNINAIELELIFNENYLDLVEILDNKSVISLWLDKPVYKNNKIYFSGIIPGGFESILQPTYDQKEFASILSLIFLSKKSGLTSIDINSARVLLNDGLGTETDVNKNNISLELLDEASEKTIFLDRKLDYESPERFSPEISRDPNIFGNQWFVAFYTQDKGSGIDSYFVFESRQYKFLSEINDSDWLLANSPYLLKDQELKSYIYIKAVDRAGNHRIEIISPEKSEISNFYQKNKITINLIILFIILFFIYYLWKRKNKK